MDAGIKKEDYFDLTSNLQLVDNSVNA